MRLDSHTALRGMLQNNTVSAMSVPSAVHSRRKLIGLTGEDVLRLSTKFWDLQMDYIHAVDRGAAAILSIQYNLAAGTVAPFAEKRPELRPLLDQVMRFEVLYVR